MSFFFHFTNTDTQAYSCKNNETPCQVANRMKCDVDMLIITTESANPAIEAGSLTKSSKLQT